MRCWHESLIPKLCRQHLLGMWRECNGMYKIITENKKGYRNHPAVREFENCPDKLYARLCYVSSEMLKRNYSPNLKLLNKCEKTNNQPKEWQSLDEQIKILREKKKTTNCKCKV